MNDALTSPLPSLFDRLQQAREQVATLASRRKEKQEARRFEERAQQLSVPARSLDEAASHATVLAEADVPVQGIDVEALGRWRARLDGLLTAFQQDPASILEPAPGENPRIVLFEPLRKSLGEVNKGLTLSWRRWVEDRVPPIPAELLQVLEGVPALAGPVRDIRAARAQMRQASEALPSDAADIAAARVAADRLSGLWESLAGGGIPEAVVVFLRAAGQRNGAVFSLLTPEVGTWLQQHALVDTLRIRLS